MAAAKTKPKTFRVMAFTQEFTEIEISAESLENALEKSKSLKAEDFVIPQGDEIDATFKIMQVSEEWPDLYE